MEGENAGIGRERRYRHDRASKKRKQQKSCYRVRIMNKVVDILVCFYKSVTFMI